MSLFSFFKKNWQSIKGLFEGIPEELKAAVNIGVVVTDNIKKVLDSPTTDILTAIIPGDIDDKTKVWLRAKIPAILTEMKLADNCSGITDASELTACAIKVLQGLNADVQSAFLHNLSIMIAQVASDGKLTWSDGVHIMEWYYQHQYKPQQSSSQVA